MKYLTIGVLASAAIASSTVMAQEKIGIAICDDFLTKYDACMKDKPTSAKSDKLHQTIAERRADWSAKMKNPQMRATVETSCRLAEVSFSTTLSYPPNDCKM